MADWKPEDWFVMAAVVAFVAALSIWGELV